MWVADEWLALFWDTEHALCMYAMLLHIAASVISMNLCNSYRNGRFLEKGQIFFGDMWLQSM